MNQETINKIVKASGVAAGANTMFGGTNEARGHIDFVGIGAVL